MGVGEPLIVALEGPCLSGKSTLREALLRQLSDLTVDEVLDFSDYVGGGNLLPSAEPLSLDQEEQALQEYLRLEEARTRCPKSSGAAVILVDRSVHTLLAHCYALDRVHHTRYSVLAERIVSHSSVPLWPHVVLYLDLPGAVAISRNNGKFRDGDILIDPDFNDGIRCYFQALMAGHPPWVVFLDATLEPSGVRAAAEEMVRSQLGKLSIRKGDGR